MMRALLFITTFLGVLSATLLVVTLVLFIGSRSELDATKTDLEIVLNPNPPKDDFGDNP